MSNQNDIALRPRFKYGINKSKDTLLIAFDAARVAQRLFNINRIDNHVFISKSSESNQFWSPQLQIEITEIEENSSIVSGLIGPNPAIWTLFMFLHFLIAGLFIGFGIWTYTNLTLNMDYAIQISFMILMVIIWFILYFIGRLGKESSNRAINDLIDFMQDTLDIEKNKLQIENNSKLIRNLTKLN